MFNEKRKKEILKLVKGKDRVFIQVPEGLKFGAGGLVDFLESRGIETFLSVEPCFGACDLRDREAKELGCDLLLHIGHKDFGLKAKVPTAYYEYRIDYDFVPLIKRTLKRIKFRKICLLTTVQFAGNLDHVRRFMEKHEFKVYIGGEILGCDVSNAKKYDKMVDCFLFIGSGRFHPLGLQEELDKPVLFLDVEKGTFEDLYKEKMKIKREMGIQKARDLSNFAVVISSKPGQLHMKSAERVKKILKKKGKNVYVLVADQLTPEKLLGLNIDVIVNTACPRIKEDSKQFRKVILGPEDVKKL